MLELYSYFRSSAAYRVRIALNHKGIEHKIKPVNLVAAEQRSDDYLRLNPAGLVPTLKLANGDTISQSSAIIEWLEESYPAAPKLLPEDSLAKAKVRALTHSIACDIHPLNNLRVLNYLTAELDVTAAQKTNWYHHWLKQGFDALEIALSQGPYALGGKPSMLDLYLVPQVYNALRFELDMTDYPKILAAYSACNKLDAFIDAAPQNQVDAT